MHFRKQIRNGVTQILKDANINRVGSNVFPFKLMDTESQETPSIAVYTVSETGSKFNESPRMHDRDLTLVIEVRDKHPDDDGTLPDNVDDLANEIEKAILDDPFLGTFENETFIIEDTVYASTSYQFDDGDDEYIMHQSINFTVNYKSQDSISLDELNALREAHYSIKPQPATIGDSEDFTGIVTYED